MMTHNAVNNLIAHISLTSFPTILCTTLYSWCSKTTSPLGTVSPKIHIVKS